MNSIDEQDIPALAPGVRMQNDAVNGEPVLVFPEGVLFLNPTAHEIVSRCDGATRVGRIASQLAEEYEADENEIRKDVVECLTDLVQRKLMKVSK